MKIRIMRLANGQYIATADDVPGLVAQGRSKAEVVTIASRWTGNWDDPVNWHVCTDPSHPTLVQFPQQQSLYHQFIDKIRTRADSGVHDADADALIPDEVIHMFSRPSDFVDARYYRLQEMRRKIAEKWGTVFCKLDNVANTTGWFMLDRIETKGNDELNFVLTLIVLESIQTVFSTVNQLREALAAETFGYWRTLYELFVKSHS